MTWQELHSYLLSFPKGAYRLNFQSNFPVIYPAGQLEKNNAEFLEYYLTSLYIIVQKDHIELKTQTRNNTRNKKKLFLTYSKYLTPVDYLKDFKSYLKENIFSIICNDYLIITTPEIITWLTTFLELTKEEVASLTETN